MLFLVSLEQHFTHHSFFFLGTEKDTEAFRGFGHVSFEDTQSVDKAVKLAGSICLGRPLKVDYAEEREK